MERNETKKNEIFIQSTDMHAFTIRRQQNRKRNKKNYQMDILF